MKKIFFVILIFSQIAFAQNSPNRYEVEMLKNPNKGGKDTREVNAILVFEKEALKVTSRRKSEIYKEFKYSDIKFVEHSYSKTPLSSVITRSTILTLLLADALANRQKENHWLTILAEDDFAVLKIENDNYRLLRMEFLVRKFDLLEFNEDR